MQAREKARVAWRACSILPAPAIDPDALDQIMRDGPGDDTRPAEDRLKARDIMTRAAFENAMVVSSLSGIVIIGIVVISILPGIIEFLRSRAARRVG